MNEEILPPLKPEKIDVENFAKRILAIIKEEFPDSYQVIASNLSEDDDWWDNFRYLHAMTRSLMAQSLALSIIKSQIDEYASKSPDDTTFN